MHDQARRRKALRKGRETGCSIYIPGEVLAPLGLAPPTVVYYRTWQDPKRPRIMVNLYREP